MAQKNWSGLGDPLEKLESIPRDESWLKYMPEGSSVTSAVGYGASYWSQSGKIDVKLQDESTQRYFIKLSRSSVGGQQMAEGEYESMKLLYSISPEMVPQPISHGTFTTDPNTHFFLCEFVEHKDGLPDMGDFCRAIAGIHRKSQDLSLNGMFGFHVATCNGIVAQYATWTTSWQAYYTEMLKHALKLEESVHGPSSELAELLPPLFDKVIPRLLRPLETDGRVLRPTLVHGDLWDGNVQTNAKTGLPSMFDASALWTHNEFEMKGWRGARFHINRAFAEEYCNHFPASPPEEDWSDRNLLYSLRVDIFDSIMWTFTTRFRNLLIGSIRELVSRYPKGYEGTCLRKDVAEAEKSQQIE